jgi:hypothetical protein
MIISRDENLVLFKHGHKYAAMNCEYVYTFLCLSSVIRFILICIATLDVGIRYLLCFPRIYIYIYVRFEVRLGTLLKHSTFAI